MTGRHLTFHNQFCLRCPKCHRTDRVDISASIWVRLTADGTDADAALDGDHEWNSDSPAFCANCEFRATAADFRTYRCQNCNAVWNYSELKPEIPHYHERVAPDEPAPAGECQACGALCHELTDVEDLANE